MIEKLKKLYRSFFADISPDLVDDFAVHCAQKNNSRFSILPIFNIVTQITCYFIYLYIYPATFPEKPALDPLGFTLLSVVYILSNILFFILFNRLRRSGNKPNYIKSSHAVLLIFLLSYVAFESIETIMEVEISGNIYRFLATFFMVTILPIVRRREKFILLTFFTVFVEGGFIYITTQGYGSSNRFQEIILLFFLVCLAISGIAYNSAVRTFELQHNLLKVNEELKQANERLEYLAVIDPLTQISNRRAFDQYMALAWRSAFTDGRSLTVIMIDIDDFKIYNDTYGHQKGDECLCAVASCIKSYFNRQTDMVARYGGEEFIVLLVQDDVQNVRSLVEKMQLGVRQMQIENTKGKTGGYVTISVGYALAVPSEQIRYEDLIKQADDALYKAKETGKNRVYSAESL